MSGKIRQILSALLMHIPSWLMISVFTFCVIYSGGSWNENGPGAVWWLMMLMIAFLGMPMLASYIVGVVLSIKVKPKTTFVIFGYLSPVIAMFYMVILVFLVMR